MHTSGIVGFSLHVDQKVLHLLRQTLRYTKASQTNVLHSIRQLLNANEGKDEDEQDDEMSEPPQLTRTEKRKEIQMDETAKELRAMLPATDSSLASSLRPDETQEQLERSSKQARTVMKGVETLQDVSYLFQKGHCEQQRNGFPQVKMAGMRKSC